MVNLELTHKAPQKKYAPLHLDCPKLFAGYIIRSEYDEQRLQIDRKFNPQRFSFATETGAYNLYGLLQDTAANFVKKIENKNITNINDYSYVLALEGLSCITCFLHFSPGMYPVDSSYLSRYFPNVDLCNFNVKRNISSFQKVSHIYFFALVKYKK